MSGSICVITLWIGWAMGFFAFLGTPGLARADQQQLVLDELRAQKIERLEEAIMKEQRDYCHSEGRARETYLGRRNMKLNEYRDVTGRSYEGLPNCDEL